MKPKVHLDRGEEPDWDWTPKGAAPAPNFPSDPSEAEQLSVNSIEHWRRALGVASMILLSHSLGGYLATCYSIQHPQRVKPLILVDPWGFEHRPEGGIMAAARAGCPYWVEALILVDPWGFEHMPEGGISAAARAGCPYWVEALVSVASLFNPVAVMRAVGPWGPKLIHRFRHNIKSKFEDMFDDETMTHYIYHCNAQSPSGEVGFRVMSEALLWAKRPMLDRVHLLPLASPSRWPLGCAHGWTAEQEVVKGASHHSYADQPEEFNRVVQRICDSVVD
ncbi:hypothetical protein ACEWY4_014963 [Coilia grayii]|uniref:AB hydrolase-1 domain-containing protein n=1 Tax=Coilia grayii TaxID=363190 RepID=A0ABD1JTY5_9TELE